LARDEPHGLPPELRRLVTMIATELGDDECREEAVVLLSRTDDSALSTAQLEILGDILAAAEPNRPSQNNGTPRSPAMEKVIAFARRVIENREADDRKLLAAMRLVADSKPEDAGIVEALRELLSPQRSPDVQRAAVNLAARMRPEVAGELLLSGWSGYSPTLRTDVIDVFMSRDELWEQLLHGVSSGVVKSSQIDALQRQRLLAHAAPQIRAAAAAAFDGGISPDRKKVLESYAEAARLPGNAEQGRQLFQKVCASCHRLGDYGHAVGPDLAALTSPTPASLLEAILDPNRTVDDRYQTYTAVTGDGRTYTGILSGETAVSITLREQQDKD
jgi:mono/diheme cytochrome c family protein